MANQMKMSVKERLIDFARTYQYRMNCIPHHSKNQTCFSVQVPIADLVRLGWLLHEHHIPMNGFLVRKTFPSQSKEVTIGTHPSLTWVDVVWYDIIFSEKECRDLMDDGW